LDPANVCGRPESEHRHSAWSDSKPKRATGAELIRQADAAQYARPPIPTADVGRIKVRLLNATPDPLGSVAALIEQYKGNVIRDLAEVTDEQRRAAIDEMGKTVLNGPLEAVQFHWQIEGVTRAITHQMVRSRASFFAQESLRFAVPTGNWADEIPLPPSLAGIDRWDEEQISMAQDSKMYQAFKVWRLNMMRIQAAYERLIELGVPAEEARGILPHDMPTRIHWVCDLRTLLADAGKRTCTQAQFPWRVIFAGMAQALREYGGQPREGRNDGRRRRDGWQFREIAARLRPYCYQNGSCGFMAKFDRGCTIRDRVDAFAAAGVPSSEWGERYGKEREGLLLKPIHDYEWAANPAAARS
jgi:flavin-dependent thymidylate synthase